MSDESEEKQRAVEYLEEALKNKKEYIEKILLILPANISKQELVDALHGAFFYSYKLRLAITGRKYGVTGPVITSIEAASA